MNTLADCFLHGDCHTDNVVIEDSHLIWLDWQGAGAGNPAAELAFPSVRATPSGASLPQQDMVDRYAGDRDLDSARVSRATLAAELAIFLLTWPEYASYNTDTGIGRVHRHVQQLARRWLAGQ
jgi:aminoglycoside phosphotransferase (APT) family kinase protein